MITKLVKKVNEKIEVNGECRLIVTIDDSKTGLQFTSTITTDSMEHIGTSIEFTTDCLTNTIGTDCEVSYNEFEGEYIFAYETQRITVTLL